MLFVYNLFVSVADLCPISVSDGALHHENTIPAGQCQQVDDEITMGGHYCTKVKKNPSCYVAAT